MATLLSIAQRVARRSGFGDQQLSTIVGNPDVFAQRVLDEVNGSGRRIARRHEWSFMIVIDNQLTTVASQAEYSMPSDFDRLLRDTNWDKSNNWRMRGAIQPKEWRHRKDAIDQSNQLRKVFRRSGSTIVIDPTPSAAGEILSVPYVSKNWCQSSAAAGQDEWLADDDEPIIDEELLELDVRWRLLNGRAPYFEEKEEFERALRERIAADLAFPSMNLGGSDDAFDVFNVTVGNLPVSGFDGGFG